MTLVFRKTNIWLGNKEKSRLTSGNVGSGFKPATSTTESCNPPAPYDCPPSALLQWGRCHGPELPHLAPAGTPSPQAAALNAAKSPFHPLLQATPFRFVVRPWRSAVTHLYLNSDQDNTFKTHLYKSYLCICWGDGFSVTGSLCVFCFGNEMF